LSAIQSRIRSIQAASRSMASTWSVAGVLVCVNEQESFPKAAA